MQRLVTKDTDVFVLRIVGDTTERTFPTSTDWTAENGVARPIRGLTVTGVDARRVLAQAPAGKLRDVLLKVLKRCRFDQELWTIDQVAALTGLSVRTFQRRLAAEGASWKGLVECARREMAEQMLTESRTKVGDIARRLGYSSLANFDRAFLRWTGNTPTHYRTQHCCWTETGLA